MLIGSNKRGKYKSLIGAGSLAKILSYNLSRIKNIPLEGLATELFKCFRE